MDHQQKSRSRRALGGFIAAVLGASVLSIAAVSAQTNSSSDCSGDSITEIDGVQLLVGSVTTADVVLDAVLPAGTYDLNAASFDAYEGRGNIPAQAQEQWVVEFLGADGAVLATSQPTADLPDGTDAAFWSGSIGTVTLASDAVSARVVHAVPSATGANSVFPSCFGATAVAVTVATTEAPPETVAVTTVAPTPDLSSITLDYDSVATATSSAAVVCDESADTGSGDAIDIVITGIEPGTSCVVAYPQNLACSVIVDPTSANIGERPGELQIGLPVEAAIDVVVDIGCTDRQVGAPAFTTTVAPAPAATTAPAAVETTPTTVATQVQSNTATTAAPAVTTTTVAPQATQTAPAAPTAQPRVIMPAFTG